jgi:hypothetical protein
MISVTALALSVGQTGRREPVTCCRSSSGHWRCGALGTRTSEMALRTFSADFQKWDQATPPAPRYWGRDSVCKCLSFQISNQ